MVSIQIYIKTCNFEPFCWGGATFIPGAKSIPDSRVLRSKQIEIPYLPIGLLSIPLNKLP